MEKYMIEQSAIAKNLFELELLNFDNQKVSLNKYRGKKLCIFMWASW
jgi:hypothetical protein